jgi:hypothetical protein
MTDINPDDVTWIDDDSIYKNFIAIYKKGSPRSKQNVKDFFKKDITENEIAFDLGYEPLIGERPKNARKGEELGSFRKEICKMCNSPILAKFWGTIFNGQSIDKTGLCEKCRDGGFLDELGKETDRMFREENR